MRENLSLNQYNKKFLFIEHNPLFNRYDIIERIRSYTRLLTHFKQVGIIYYRKNKYVLKIISKNTTSAYPGQIHALIDMFLKDCRIPIIYFTENGAYDLSNTSNAECYISGLHTDIPNTIAEYIHRKYPAIETVLSKINYLASQVLIIAELLQSNNDIFYLLPRQ
ncbi:hypothetical protein [Staphylothermus hellenicus]|uniref:Uncharacterized protein n=1 Tax=Staphylothermus hellenicus (strain DSM 12710 / JCM 10830 / BK20S6-10-b1 / P8) TaxID=591019 RepID=D7DA86_STAHD|nr:hypothetical protein [Staphylothermus hellenicus]ADI32682.1 hypothetical protein Shell_1594 [Staphylothermus hellenicus DSM 12710]